MFTTLIVQPIFNLLTLIYAILPGHNFGLAIILFTVVVRLALWPLVRKQLHQAKAMRALQPELKRIKKAAAGNRQQEQAMMMELYKERGVNPFGSIGLLILQLPILIGLYSGLRRVIDDPHALVSFSYPALQHFGWMKELAANIHRFDSSLFGVVDLTKSAFGPHGKIYWPAMVIVLGSAVVQFYQSKQLMPKPKDGRNLRSILKDAGQGRQADQAEVNAAVGQSTRYFLPVMIFLFTVTVASALSLYWLVGGLVAFIQQSIVLREDSNEMEDEAGSTPGKAKKTVIEGEVVEEGQKQPAAAKAGSTTAEATKTPKPKPVKAKKASRNAKKKRRK